MASTAATSSPVKEFVTSRTFDAPVVKVWKAWTEREELMKWFSPKGFAMTTAKLDFRPGGTFHYCMRGADGKEMWGKFIYREIAPRQKIVLDHSFSDEKGGVTRHPFSATWPLVMLSNTTFAEAAGKTTVTVHWSPQNPTAEERQTFDSSHEGMKMGWGGTFDQLAEYLGKSTEGISMQVQPYLFFDGRSQEALDFYVSAVGAEIQMKMKFKDSPVPPPPGSQAPDSGEKVMHARMKIGDTVVLVSDGECGGRPKFDGFALSLNIQTEAEADRLFAALAQGGQVQMPLTKTFFSPKFGMLSDKFGVKWMIHVAPDGAK